MYLPINQGKCICYQLVNMFGQQIESANDEYITHVERMKYKSYFSICVIFIFKSV